MTATETAPASGLRLELRPYQEEALAATVTAASATSRRLLAVLATGLGKTIIFSTLAARLGELGLELPSTDVLILAHRDELIGQAVDKLRMVWPGAPVGVVMAKDDHFRAPVVVASVQTLSREKRLARLANRRFGLIVVDEAHHSAAASYQRILNTLGAGDPAKGLAAERLEDRPLLLGVTATPDRADRVGLDVAFDTVVCTYDLLWGIQAGYLSDLRGKRIVLEGVDLSKIRTRAGDYAQDDLAEALGKANAAGHAVAAYNEHAPGRKALDFTVSVAEAHAHAAAFVAAGIPAEAVSGETPRDERRAILARLASGETRVVANCAVLTEGFDEPSVDCIIVSKPTKSRGLYVQMVGRGTRRHPGKDDCVVLDLVGVTDDLDLVTLPDLFGLPVDALETDAVAVASERYAASSAATVDAAVALAAREVALWERKFREARLNWIQQDQFWVLPAEAGFVALRPEGDTWRTVIKPRRGGFRTLVAGVDLDTAMSVGEDHIRRWAMRVAVRSTAAARGRTKLTETEVDEAVARGDVDAREVAKATAVIRADARWRSNPPTEKQRGFARTLGIDPASFRTAGELSDAIDARRAVSRLKRAKV